MTHSELELELELYFASIHCTDNRDTDKKPHYGLTRSVPLFFRNKQLAGKIKNAMQEQIHVHTRTVRNRDNLKHLHPKTMNKFIYKV